MHRIAVLNHYILLLLKMNLKWLLTCSKTVPQNHSVYFNTGVKMGHSLLSLTTSKQESLNRVSSQEHSSRNNPHQQPHPHTGRLFSSQASPGNCNHPSNQSLCYNKCQGTRAGLALNFHSWWVTCCVAGDSHDINISAVLNIGKSLPGTTLPSYSWQCP